VAASIRPAGREKGRYWSHTLPGPQALRRKPFATEQGGLDSTNLLHFKVDIAIKCHHTAGIDLQGFFTRPQILLHHVTASVNEYHAVAFILAASISLVTIATAWIFYRPLLGIGVVIMIQPTSRRNKLWYIAL
jgi:hypothetical protein